MKLWLARDKDGELIIHINKPFKKLDYWKSDDDCMAIPDTIENLPEIKWSDDVPIEVKMVPNVE